MPQSPTFSALLQTDTKLLLDGGTGTELYNRGIFINRCFEEANLSNPELILQLHREYLEAGAQVLSTNSWGANYPKLCKHNFHDKLRDMNRQAAQLARTAAQGKAWIAGSVGPLGIQLEPFGPTSYQEGRTYFQAQIEALQEGGVDLLSLETFTDLSEIRQAILAAREVAPELPIIAYLSMTPEGTLPTGTPIAGALQQLAEWKVDVIGLNCSVGPQPMFTQLEPLLQQLACPISVRPNAGLPRLVEGRQIYMSSPEYLAHFAGEFYRIGVRFVGGCCGTSPAHIRAMANAGRHATAMSRPRSAITSSSIKNDVTTQPIAPIATQPFRERSAWSRKIADGEPVSSVELLPPAGADPSKVIAQSRQLKEAGVDAINIPDGPRASARMSALLTAVMIEAQAGIETVLHYTCRDRNLLGMQSDLLGAQAIGLRNMLLITGDPPKLGAYPDATGVFDVDAIGLTNMAHRLNCGIDLGERAIGTPCSLSLGVGVNPVHRNFQYEMDRFAWKVDAGAEWAITQPVFDINALERFLNYLEQKNWRIPIIAGIWPLVSHRNAVFMNNEVPGVVIPPEIIDRMAQSQDAESAKKVGVDIARQMVEALGRSVAGIQVSAPFGRIDLALAVLGKT